MLKRAIITVFTLFAMCSVALADDWVASKLRGGVFIFTAGEWVQLKRGDVVSDDSAVQTAKNARVVFKRGKESISLRGDTRIRISDKNGSKYTVVSQDFGEITVDVEKRNVQHFEVRAPLLAAVVKGTKFTVTATRGRGAASIDVERGRVEARDDRAGMKVDVKPRQKVELNVKDKPVLTVEGSGAKEPIRSTATGEVLSVKEIIKKAEKANPKAKIKAADVQEIANQQGQPLTAGGLDAASSGVQQAQLAAGDAAQNAQAAAAAAAAAEAEKAAADAALEAAKASGDKAAIDAAKDAVEAAKDAEKAAEDAAKDAAKDAKEAEKAAEDAAKDAEKAAEDAAKAAEDAAKEAEKAAEDAAKDAEKAAEDAAKAAAKAEEDAAKDAAKAAEDAAKAEEEAAKDAAKAAEDAAKEAEKAAKDAAKEAEKAAKDAAKLK